MIVDVLFEPVNGVGDKLCDIIGAMVLCDVLDKSLHVNLNTTPIEYMVGKRLYDSSLFNIKGITIANNDQTIISRSKLLSVNPSVSLSPVAVYDYLKNKHVSPYPGMYKEIDESTVTFKSILELYKKKASDITPSDDINKNIPLGIENAIGVHVRKSDKVLENRDVSIEVNQAEHEILIEHLIRDLKKEDNNLFFVTSENKEWKETIKKMIGDNAQFIEYDVPSEDKDGYHAVLDMFTLSRCKKIYQGGVRYSTFSLVSSLIGNIELVNYAHTINDYDKCIIQLWDFSKDSPNRIQTKFKIEPEFV
jgi:hypothetical protein